MKWNSPENVEPCKGKHFIFFFFFSNLISQDFRRLDWNGKFYVVALANDFFLPSISFSLASFIYFSSCLLCHRNARMASGQKQKKKHFDWTLVLGNHQRTLEIRSTFVLWLTRRYCWYTCLKSKPFDALTILFSYIESFKL